MTRQPPKDDPPSPDAALQRRIAERLGRLVGPGAAAFYRDACRTMSGAISLESASHLVGHCMREIESALLAVVEPISQIPDEDSENGHRAKIRAALQVLGMSDRQPAAQAWLAVGPGLHGKAHRRNLAPPRSLDEPFGELWSKFNVFLDGVLDRLEARFLEIARIVDGIRAKESPTPADAALLVNQIPNHPIAQALVFEKLTGPKWLDLLSNAGAFGFPPPPVEDLEKKTIGYPGWPQSRYLGRMADELAPSLQPRILDVIMSIPSTENVRIHTDLVQAVGKLQPDLIARAVPRIQEWLASRGGILLPNYLGDLVSRLARAGQSRPALDLAGSLFELFPDPRAAELEAADTGGLFHPEPQARMDAWNYEQILKENIPDLVDTAPREAFMLLCDLLRRAVELSNRSDGALAEDYSYIWRPRIEDLSQRLHGSKDVLTTAVYRAGSQIVTKDPASLPWIVEELEKRAWPILKRLALQLLRETRPFAEELIEDKLRRPEDYDDPDYHREYRLLLNEQFTRLSPEGQEHILSSLGRGPDTERIRAGLSHFFGRPASEDEIREEKDHWLLERLGPIAGNLVGEWKEKHDGLAAKYGAPPPFAEPAFRSHISWVGPQSPKGATELQEMSDDALLEFMASWKEETDPRAPSLEGLGRQVTIATVANPARFAALSSRFMGLDPAVVRGLLDGLRDALGQGARFDWEPVLKLCKWVVTQPREIPGRQGMYADLDPGWVWTRKTIADLLSTGLEDKTGTLPNELRESCWQVLEQLTDDPDPSTDDETSRPATSSMAPSTRSINTVRGQAMHAVVKYALWTQKQSGGQGTTERREPGLEGLPEVRRVLDAHLKPEKETTLAVRSVYGQWFPWLLLLDDRWARENVPRIFPPAESDVDSWRAAWDAFIVFSHPSPKILEALRDEYARAITRMGALETEQWHPGNADLRLGQHLVSYAAQGLLLVGEPESPLAQFFVKASPDIRAEVVSSVGFDLYHAPKVEAAILQRLKDFWQWRLEVASASPEKSKRELAAFGWWFASKHLDAEWSLGQLLRVLQLGIMPESHHLVAERLADLVEHRPAQAVECLSLLLANDREEWLTSAWREQARKILSFALERTEGETRDLAVDLVHRLGARGLFEFRDLLGGESKTGSAAQGLVEPTECDPPTSL